jgi:hypothetical protein
MAAHSDFILDKIARNATQLGLTVTRGASSVTIENGSNDLVISYVDAVIASPMGGIDGNTSPFLGIGTVNPGKIKIAGAGVNTANPGTVAELIDSAVAAQVLVIVCGFGNDLQLFNANAGAGADLDIEIRAFADLRGMGR